MEHYRIGKDLGINRTSPQAARRGRGQWWLVGWAGVGLGLGWMAQAQLRYEPLRAFGLDARSASNPSGGVVLASNGLLYGVTSRGGSNGLGTVYQVAPDGTGYRVIKHFQGSDGAVAAGQLLDGGDGMLYGITGVGGDSTNGVIFRIGLDGGGFSVLRRLAGGAEGALPLGGLTALPGGDLAGVASQAGAHGGGTVFRLGRDGSNFQVLRAFGGTADDGATPKARLLLAADGFLYGTTERGGNTNAGTLIRIAPNGANYEVLHRFQAATEAYNPDFGLIEGPGGWLYGLGAGGGTGSVGTIYRFRPTDRRLEVLHAFSVQNRTAGYRPSALRFNATRTVLWGTTLSGGVNEAGVFFQINPDGSNYRVLADLGPSNTGRFLFGELAQTPDGRLLSTTLAGGPEQTGTLMACNPLTGELQVLIQFLAYGQDAKAPSADLLEGADGFLYGTSAQGGRLGKGTVFRLRKDQTAYQILHHFGEAAEDGESPTAPLVQDGAGTLYGTTAYRADAAAGGTVFRMQPDGSGYQVLKRFTNRSTEGALIVGGLSLTPEGWLLGLTVEGGTFNGGTCFRLRPDGSGFQVLRAFGQGTDGSAPGDGLVSCGDGYWYGILNSKGAFEGGAVFRITADGAYQVLRSFGQTAGDGTLPVGGLLCRDDGYLYGTCAAGGQNGQGTVFRLRRDGSDYAVIHHFNPTAHAGIQPRSRLVEWADGRLYGTTYSDALSGLGTVFSLNPDGSQFSTVVRFLSLTSEGSRPWAGLIAASDGALYGVLSQGGLAGAGRLYRISHDGWVRFLAVEAVSNGQRIELTGQGVAGARYRIERSPEVGPGAVWSEIGLTQADAAGRWELSAPVEAGQPRAFFRASRRP